MTKPLQFLMVQSIISQLEKRDRFTLLVVDGFGYSFEFSHRVADSDLGWFEVEWFPSKKDAYSFLAKNKFSEIFLDSDVGFRNFLSLSIIKLSNLSSKIIVYEEGIGSYRNDLYKGASRLILNTIGAGTSFGACSITSEVYLTNPLKYRVCFPGFKKKCIKIEESIFSLVQKNIEKLLFIFGVNEFCSLIKTNIKSNECVVYLSSWNVDYSIIKRVLSFDGDKYIKLHPHIEEKLATGCNGLDVVNLPSNAPAEIFLSLLCREYKRVKVFHHNSSVRYYVHDSKVIDYVEIAN